LKTVGTLVPQHTPSIAAKLLGRPDLSRAAIGRIALRVYKGADPFGALQQETREHKEISGHSGVLNFQASDELADVGEGVNRAQAIRAGLGMIMGMSPEEAQSWAKLPRTGRPPKDRSSSGTLIT
jgi:hypothetical protein